MRVSVKQHVTGLAVLLVALLAVAACTPAAPAATTPASAATPGPVHLVFDAEVHPLDTPSPDLPVTVTSADGVEVTVTDVSRILAVDLYGTLAETVFSLGLGDLVVGRDTSTGFSAAEHLPLVTVGGHQLSAEAVLDLDPTVVLTDTTIGPPEIQQQLRDAGIPVVFFDPTRTLDGIPAQIEAVAAALGVPEAGAELADRTQQQIQAALPDPSDTTGSAAEPGDTPRVAFLYLRGSAVSLLGGPGSGADELIRAVGAEDAGTAIGLERSFVAITSEALVEAAPDALLLLEGGMASVDGMEGLLRVPGVAQTPAGANRHVITVEDTELLSFGPRTGAVLEALAAALRGSTGDPA